MAIIPARAVRNQGKGAESEALDGLSDQCRVNNRYDEVIESSLENGVRKPVSPWSSLDGV